MFNQTFYFLKNALPGLSMVYRYLTASKLVRSGEWSVSPYALEKHLLEYPGWCSNPAGVAAPVLPAGLLMLPDSTMYCRCTCLLYLLV